MPLCPVCCCCAQRCHGCFAVAVCVCVCHAEIRIDPWVHASVSCVLLLCAALPWLLRFGCLCVSVPCRDKNRSMGTCLCVLCAAAVRSAAMAASVREVG